MAKISIIVPIYNVEKYLRQCLESIRIQTLSDFEVLMVEDASTDNSLSIAKEYVQKDSRFILLQHEKNKGYGAAMNTGLFHAKAEWLTFVESDDFLAENALEVLYQQAKEEADMVFSIPFFYNFFSNNTKYIETYWGKKMPTQIMNSKDDLNIFLTRTEPWGILYKKSLFTENNILFFEEKIEGKSIMFQDLALSFHLKILAKKIVILSTPIYYYRAHEINSVGQMGKYKNSIFFPFLFNDINEQYEKNKNYFSNDLLAVKHKIFYDIISSNFSYFSMKILEELRKIIERDVLKNNILLSKEENKLYLAFAQNRIKDPRLIWVKILRHPRLNVLFIWLKKCFYSLPEELREKIRK